MLIKRCRQINIQNIAGARAVALIAHCAGQTESGLTLLGIAGNQGSSILHAGAGVVLAVVIRLGGAGGHQKHGGLSVVVVASTA